MNDDIFDPHTDDDDEGDRTPAEENRYQLAKLIWETSRADEGTISATGANKIAAAVDEHFGAEAKELYEELMVLRTRYAQAIKDLQGMHAQNLDHEKRRAAAVSETRVANAQRDAWFDAKEEAERREYDTFKALGYVLKELGGRVEITYRDLVGVAGGITTWTDPQKSVLVLRWDDPSGRP